MGYCSCAASVACLCGIPNITRIISQLMLKCGLCGMPLQSVGCNLGYSQTIARVWPLLACLCAMLGVTHTIHGLLLMCGLCGMPLWNVGGKYASITDYCSCVASVACLCGISNTISVVYPPTTPCMQPLAQVPPSVTRDSIL